MPSDMLREMWLGLKRFWGLRWIIKGPILAVLALGILGVIGSLVGGEEEELQRQEAAAIAGTGTAAATLEASQPAPTLEPSPTPAPVSTPTREPTPTRPPTPPPSIYKLALISGQCTLRSDIGFTECEGFVENISGKPLENVEVVIVWVYTSGTPVSTDKALIDYNPVLAGQQSPWSTIGDYNPALTKFRIQFKELLGGTIPTRDDRPE